MFLQHQTPLLNLKGIGVHVQMFQLPSTYKIPRPSETLTEHLPYQELRSKLLTFNVHLM